MVKATSSSIATVASRLLSRYKSTLGRWPDATAGQEGGPAWGGGGRVRGGQRVGRLTQAVAEGRALQAPHDQAPPPRGRRRWGGRSRRWVAYRRCRRRV